MKTAVTNPAFKRPVVWVTGASKGIGREIAKEFAATGYDVYLSSRSNPSLQSAVKEITKLGGKAHPVPVDIRKRRSVFDACRRIEKMAGQIDILVNNAGITAFKSFVDTTSEEIENIIQTNLLGHMFCAKAVLPGMIKRRRGMIVNIISHAAIKTFTNSSAYTASKAGVFGWGKAIREELGEYNIKVVNVLPGATETEMWPEKVRKKHSSGMMKPKSIAETIVAIAGLPDDIVVDEIVLRPVPGDLN